MPVDEAPRIAPFVKRRTTRSRRSSRGAAVHEAHVHVRHVQGAAM